MCFPNKFNANGYLIFMRFSLPTLKDVASFVMRRPEALQETVLERKLITATPGHRFECKLSAVQFITFILRFLPCDVHLLLEIRVFICRGALKQLDTFSPNDLICLIDKSVNSELM